MKLGVGSFLNQNEVNLKRQYLLLDNIFLDGYQEVLNAVSGKLQSGSLGLGIGLSLGYMEAFKSKKINNYINSIWPSLEFLADDRFLVNMGIDQENIGQGSGNDLSKKSLGFVPWDLYKDFQFEKLVEIQHFSARLKSSRLKHNNSFDTIPLLGNLINSDIKINSKYQTIEVIINNFPILNENIPWEELRQFKKEFKLDHLRLKNYMNKLTNEEYKKYELFEKIEFELEELRQWYKFHNIDYTSSKCHVVMTVGEVFQDLLNKKIIDAFSKVININKMNINLLRKELDIPNNQLSYIIKLENKFNNKV